MVSPSPAQAMPLIKYEYETKLLALKDIECQEAEAQEKDIERQEAEDAEERQQAQEKDDELTEPPPGESDAEKHKRLCREIIKARNLKGKGAINEARRIIKEEGLMPVAPMPAKKDKKVKEDKKDEKVKGEKRSASSTGGVPMGEDKASLLEKIMSGGAIQTLDEYNTAHLLIKSQRTMYLRKVNSDKPSDEEARRMKAIQGAIYLAAKEFDPKYNHKEVKIDMNEKRAKVALTVIAEEAREAVAELRVKDTQMQDQAAEIARLRAELAARQ